MSPSPEPDPTPALRPVTDADREFLLLLYASTREEELVLTSWDDAAREQFLRSQFDLQDRHFRGAHPRARFDVVELDGAPVGRLLVDRSAEEIRVLDIALLPAFRARGLGRGLLEGLLREAELGGLPVRLHVRLGNPARRLYARLGFRSLGVHGIHEALEWKASGARGPGEGPEK